MFYLLLVPTEATTTLTERIMAMSMLSLHDCLTEDGSGVEDGVEDRDRSRLDDDSVSDDLNCVGNRNCVDDWTATAA